MDQGMAEVVLGGIAILAACLFGAWQIWPIISSDRRKKLLFIWL